MASVYVIDNYDSFVYNVVYYIKKLGIDTIKVVKNDHVDWNEIGNYSHILLSPGPGIPHDAGAMMQVIENFYQTHVILGICLGHQAIGCFFGWELQQLAAALHGISSTITLTATCRLFENLPQQFTIGHYHSWVVKSNEQTDLEFIATDEKGNVMALQHKRFPIFGVQFHPESVLTEKGIQILNNWINIQPNEKNIRTTISTSNA